MYLKRKKIIFAYVYAPYLPNDGIWFLYNKNHIIMSVSTLYLLFLQKPGSSHKRELMHLTNVGIYIQVVKELEIEITIGFEGTA